jgi:hypothetical protein
MPSRGKLACSFYGISMDNNRRSLCCPGTLRTGKPVDFLVHLPTVYAVVLFKKIAQLFRCPSKLRTARQLYCIPILIKVCSILSYVKHLESVQRLKN